jgi:membrane associated rhomboid family serine protease
VIFLVPLGPDADLPRLPRATLSLIAVSVLAFLWTSRFDTAGAAAEAARLERIADWTLRLVARDDPALAEARRAYPSALDYLGGDSGWREVAREGEMRERLERCLVEWRDLRGRHPFYRWGMVPAEVTLPRLVAHQFLHGDVVHLLFNMLFLWAVGGVIEAVWGGPLLAVLYLTFGFAAALTHAAFARGSTEPAVGASGAVAGLMGFFAVAHGREPMRLAMVAALALAPRIKLFSLPAAVFLGLWAVEQVFWLMMTAGARTAVAFHAHVGGFVFGALTALALRAFGLPLRRPV